MAMPPGTRIGVYEVLSPLGEGGMGEVYRGRDARLNRDVAIKVLLPAVANDPDRLTRFAREAQVLAALNHPNIAAIYGFEDSVDARALVMELVEGPTLADRIARGPLPIKEALAIARQIADALEAAHDQGIVHRDLKPANIKVRDDGTVKVLDFGLAKALDPAAKSSANLDHSPTISFHATQAGIILGTAAYMSPEQASGKAVDKRTDLWALGVVLFEMLTGKRLFDGETASHVIAAVLTKDPDWSALPAATPIQVRKLLQRCLAKERKVRLADAADARFEIDEALSSPTPAQVASPVQGRRLTLPIAAAAIAGAVIGVAGGVAFMPADPVPVVTSLELTTGKTSAPSNFSVSPDGRHIAYVAGMPLQLWVRSLDQAEARPLSGTENAEYPFWAPDSRRLGFFAGAKLKRTDFTGQAPVTLADAPVGTGGAWNANDVIVFSYIGSALLKVAAAGGSVAPVTRVTAPQRGHGWPQFLPDGRQVLFLVVAEDFIQSRVSVTSIDTGEIRELFVSLTPAVYAPPGYLLRVIQNSLVAQRFDPVAGVVSGDPVPIGANVGENDGRLHASFSVSNTGMLIYRTGIAFRRELAWVDGAGKRIAPVADGQILSSLALSPDGRRVAYARVQQGNNDIWLSSVSDPVPTRFTFHSDNDLMPIWSPDGQRIMFASQRNRTTNDARSDLFVKPATGAGEEQLFLGTPEVKWPLDWSQDGRYVLYSTWTEKTLGDLWAVGTGEERKPFAVLQDKFNESEGQFASSGRWLAYTSDESGRDEVYLRTFPEPAGKWQVSTTGGDQPRWSADGRMLYFVQQGSDLMRVPVAAAPDNRSIAIGAPARLFAARIPRRSSFFYTARYAVSPEGQFLMSLDADADEVAPIKIVLNWTAALAGK